MFRKSCAKKLAGHRLAESGKKNCPVVKPENRDLQVQIPDSESFTTTPLIFYTKPTRFPELTSESTTTMLIKILYYFSNTKAAPAA